MPGRHYAAEGRREVAVTHLALLGVKIAGNGILGVILTNEELLHTEEKMFLQKRSCADVSKDNLVKPRKTGYTKELGKTKDIFTEDNFG